MRRVCIALFGDQWFSQRFKSGVVALALVCLTYVLCVSDPWRIFGFLSGESKHTFEASDKVLHAGSYFALSLIFMWHAATRSRTVVIAWLIIAMAHGIGTEIVQRFVPYRTFDLADIAADACGVVLGALVGLRLRRFVNDASRTLATCQTTQESKSRPVAVATTRRVPVGNE